MQTKDLKSIAAGLSEKKLIKICCGQQKKFDSKSDFRVLLKDPNLNMKGPIRGEGNMGVRGQ